MFIEIRKSDTEKRFFEGINPIAYIILIVGIIAVFWGATKELKRTLAIFHANLMFWLGVAQGGAVFYALIKITRGYWATPILRFIPFGTPLLPILTSLFILEWIFQKEIFPYHEIYHHLRFPFWLDPKLLFPTDALLLIIMNILSIRLVSLSISLDGYKVPLIPFSKVDEETARKRIKILSPILITLYVLFYTFLSWDQAMYLTPHWISTIFGARFFISLFLTYLAFLAIIVSSLVQKQNFVVGEKYLANITTLLFGFSIFWTYLFYAEFIIIYMGNIPEFTTWYTSRIRAETNWVFFLQIIFIFVIPFITLLNIPIKKNPKIVPVIATIMLIGLFLRSYDITYQTIMNFSKPGILELLITAGFASLTYIVSKSYLNKVSLPWWEVEENR